MKSVAYASKAARHPGSPNCSGWTGAMFSAGWPLAASRSIRVLADVHIFSRPSSMARNAVGLRLPGRPAALAVASATGLYCKSGDRRAWAADRRAHADSGDAAQPHSTWKAPTRRSCAWYFSQTLDQIDAEVRLFPGPCLRKLPNSPRRPSWRSGLYPFSVVATSPTSMEWITQAANSELKSLASRIARDIDAARARNMYLLDKQSGRRPDQQDQSHQTANVWPASYPLLRRRVLPTENDRATNPTPVAQAAPICGRPPD